MKRLNAHVADGVHEAVRQLRLAEHRSESNMVAVLIGEALASRKVPLPKPKPRKAK